MAKNETTTSDISSLLRKAGLRPTRQRMALGQLLFGGMDRHVSAEALYREASEAGVSVSLATIYNALHDFTDAGLLREITVDSARTYFDTNQGPHHHIFHERTGRLEDVDQAVVDIVALPELPEGVSITGVDVIIRMDD